MRLVCTILCLSWVVHAESPGGRWLSNLKFYDQNNYDRMELKLSGSTLTGDIGGDRFEGTFHDGRIEGVLKSGDGSFIKLAARYTDDRIVGTGVEMPRNLEISWEARREVLPGAPARHMFEPTEFQHYFSGSIKP